MTKVQFAVNRQSRMDGHSIAVLRWLSAIWLLALGVVACRGLTFGKHQIDASGRERGVERKMRRKLRLNFRRVRNVTSN